MDNVARRAYTRLLAIAYMRSGTNFIFWITAYISLAGQSVADATIVRGFFLLPLITLLADLPTGAYADRMSCRSAMRISATLDLLAFASFALTSVHPWLPFVGFALKALANAFESGSSSQLLFTLANQAYGVGEGSKKSSVHMEIVLRLASVTAGTLAAYLVARHPLAPMILASGLSLGALLLLLPHLPEQKVKDRFENITEAAKELTGGLRTLFLPAFLSLAIWVLADGWRTGTEGVTFFPYLKRLLTNPEVLGSLPLISTAIRMPIALLALKGKISIPQNAGKASTLLFGIIGLNILLMTVFQNGAAVTALATLNFGLYALRDIYQRHWLNGIVTKAEFGPVVLRSAASTIAVCAQLLGTALLALPGLAQDRTHFGMIVGAVGVLAGVVVSSGFQVTDRYRNKAANPRFD